MLLAPESNDKEMIKLYDNNTLSFTYHEIRSRYIDKEVEFDSLLDKDVKKTIQVTTSIRTIES